MESSADTSDMKIYQLPWRGKYSDGNDANEFDGYDIDDDGGGDGGDVVIGEELVKITNLGRMGNQ